MLMQNQRTMNGGVFIRKTCCYWDTDTQKQCFSKCSVHRNYLKIFLKWRFWFLRSGVESEMLLSDTRGALKKKKVSELSGLWRFSVLCTGSQSTRAPREEIAQEERVPRGDSMWKGQIWSMLPFLLRLYLFHRFSYHFSGNTIIS